MRDIALLELLRSLELEPLPLDEGAATVLTARREPSGANPDAPPSPLWVVGEVDLVTSESLLHDLLLALVGRPPGEVVLDLSRVTFIDVSGLRMLLRLRAELASRGAQLLLRAPSAPVQVLLRVTFGWPDPAVVTPGGSRDGVEALWDPSTLPPVC